MFECAKLYYRGYTYEEIQLLTAQTKDESEMTDEEKQAAKDKQGNSVSNISMLMQAYKVLSADRRNFELFARDQRRKAAVTACSCIIRLNTLNKFSRSLYAHFVLVFS